MTMDESRMFNNEKKNRKQSTTMILSCSKNARSQLTQKECWSGNHQGRRKTSVKMGIIHWTYDGRQRS